MSDEAFVTSIKTCYGQTLLQRLRPELYPDFYFNQMRKYLFKVTDKYIRTMFLDWCLYC